MHSDSAATSSKSDPTAIPWHTFDIHEWRDAVAVHGAVAGVEAALERIARRGDYLNTFSIVLENEARQRARELDAVPVGERGPLHGVPIAIKDEIDVAGCVTSFGTAGNSTPRTDDSLIVRRIREAGGIIIGKTTMPAFGAFPFTESERFGITRNPVKTTHTPGGSSGGSAASVADGMIPAAIGGDGGGSIRIPADHCGIVGLKPARGHVPPDPYDHLWFALGTAGPLTRSVRDAWLLYSIITGSYDSHDDATVSPVKPLRIGVSVRPVSPLTRLAKDNAVAVRLASDKLRKMGHVVEEFELRHPDPTPAFVVQFFAGIRAEIKGLEHPERIENRHKRTRLLGFWARGPILSWALRWSEKFGQTMDRTFDDYDVILTPSVAGRPVKTGVLDKKGALGSMIASLPSVAYTALWNVSGHPGLTVPMGIASDGLPTSVQLIASARAHNNQELFGEQLLCAVGSQLMR